MSLTKKYNINGPVNIIRLEGEGKVIYLFGDHHLPPEQQNECDDRKKESIDIDKFFRKIFKNNPTKAFDFFMETDLKYFKPDYYTYKSNYLNQVRKMVTSQVNIEDNKMQQSKDYKNIRFHYFDIRDLLLDPYNLYHKPKNIFITPYYNDYNYYRNIINDELSNIDIFLQNIDKVQIMDKLIKKTYNHKKEIINILNMYINNIINIKKRFLDMFKEVDDIEKISLSKYYKLEEFIKLQTPFYIKFINILNEFQNNVTYLTDLFLIRRFLDKEYIKNAITYCGSLHMIHIAHILINKFSFKITHVSHARCSIDQLNKEFKNMNINVIDKTYFDYLLYIDRFADPTIQCSSLENFPDNLI